MKLEIGAPYQKLYKLYDILYKDKDYKGESATISKILKEHNCRNVLDIGCGTGNHIKWLKKDFKLTGIDKNEGLLKIAKEKNPDTKFYNQDMLNLHIDKKFDAIICLFSTLAYLKNNKELYYVFERFSDHLKEGGVLIFDIPLKNRLIKNQIYKTTIKIGNTTLKVKTKNIPGSKNSKYIIEVINNESLKEGHRLGYFTIEDIQSCLENNGFIVLESYENYSGKKWGQNSEKLIMISKKV